MSVSITTEANYATLARIGQLFWLAAPGRQAPAEWVVLLVFILLVYKIGLMPVCLSVEQSFVLLSYVTAPQYEVSLVCNIDLVPIAFNKHNNRTL